MSTFFAGNDKLLLIKKQVDKDTPASLASGARALRVYEWTKNPVRAQGPLNETDATTQEGASHVTAITPSFSFGCYGRPTELDQIAEALLGLNVDSSSHAPTTHTATPTTDQPYYTIGEVNPWGYTVWDGCKLNTATFTAQDEGETELKVTNMEWLALGYTAGGTAPTLPTPANELPFIYAEAAISYNSVHLGTTNAFSLTVNRNCIREQGDSGFRAIAIVAGKFQVDGQFTRLVQDDHSERQVDTGSAAGTTPTATVYEEPVSILFNRSSSLQFLLSAADVSYETRTVAIDPANGNPYKEVLGFRTQPQTLLASNFSLVTVNAKNTPAS